MDGPAHCFLLFRAADGEGEGEVEIVELTKRFNQVSNWELQYTTRHNDGKTSGSK